MDINTTTTATVRSKTFRGRGSVVGSSPARGLRGGSQGIAPSKPLFGAATGSEEQFAAPTVLSQMSTCASGQIEAGSFENWAPLA